MKYLIFTDLHLSYNSSILPLSCKDSIYTTRLQMCIDTLKYVFDVAEKENVDKIIFGGDMFNSHTLRAEEITAFSNAMMYYDNKIPFILITGNHDILDNNSNFYSSSVLDLFDNVTIYNQPTKIDDELSVLPYLPFSKVTADLLKDISNKILVSHIDIYGSMLGNKYELDFGVEPNLFNSFTKVFNGHIHNQQVLSENVMNIGSCVSHSFSDDEDYIPSFIIYDSEKDEVESFENPYSILFRSLDTREESLVEFVEKCLQTNYKYVLRVVTDNKSKTTSILNKYPDMFISYRVITNSINNDVVKEELDEVDINYDNLTKQFEDFLHTQESLKYPLKDYLDVIHEVD